MLAKEQVEFAAVGIDQLTKDVESLNKGIEDVHESNKNLKRALSDGTFTKLAKEYSTAKKELASLRKESEALQRVAQRNALNAKYGRAGGMLAMHGGSALRGAAGLGQGFLNSGLAGAGALGASFGVAALANRGFAGTGAEARLSLSLDRLGKHVAYDLLPAMTALTDAIESVNKARTATRNGTATTQDKLISYGSQTAMYGGAAAGTVLAAALSKIIIQKAFPAWAARIGGGVAATQSGLLGAGSAAGRALFGGTRLVGGVAAASIYGGVEAVGTRYRADLMNSETRRRGLGIIGSDEIQANKDLVEQARAIGDPAKRKAFLRQSIGTLTSEDRSITDRQSGQSMFGYLASHLFGSAKADVATQRKLNARLSVAHGLLREADGKGSLNQESAATMNVEGAGQLRNSSTDLYNELAEGAAKYAMGKGPDNNRAKDAGEDNLTVIRDILTDLARAMGIR